MPHGVLFRGGAEGKIRQKLIEENLLDAVIGLPANLFFGTGIPAAILVFDRAARRAAQRRAAGRALHRRQPGVRGRQEPEPLCDEPTSTRSSTPSQRARPWTSTPTVATLEEIAENDFNLNIPRYVDTFEEEEEIDIAAVQKEIEQTGGRARRRCGRG